MNKKNSNQHPQWPQNWYDRDCTKCERLHQFLNDVNTRYPEYFCRPVPPFGEINARLLIVGLAPGMHGANATGRPFTGDYAGKLLYETLHHFGFATKAQSIHADDDLRLIDCRITNAVKCLPPQNKPIGAEEKNCNPFLRTELDQSDLKVVLALGALAHRAVLRSAGLRLNQHPFSHNAVHKLDHGFTLIDSYHCSRYNTQTKRLTEAMFHDVFRSIVKALETVA